VWAFGVSKDGLGLPEKDLWHLTDREHAALYAVYLQGRGIAPPLTQEERAQLARNETYLLEQKARAHNRKVEQTKLRLVERRERRKANG
jgi:hypothetical protein